MPLRRRLLRHKESLMLKLKLTDWLLKLRWQQLLLSKCKEKQNKLLMKLKPKDSEFRLRWQQL